MLCIYSIIVMMALSIKWCPQRTAPTSHSQVNKQSAVFNENLLMSVSTMCHQLISDYIVPFFNVVI